MGVDSRGMRAAFVPLPGWSCGLIGRKERVRATTCSPLVCASAGNLCPLQGVPRPERKGKGEGCVQPAPLLPRLGPQELNGLLRHDGSSPGSGGSGPRQRHI